MFLGFFSDLEWLELGLFGFVLYVMFCLYVGDMYCRFRRKHRVGRLADE